MRLSAALLLLGVASYAAAQPGAQEQTREAEASQPPVRTLRGGTLGVPNYGPSNAAGLASFSVGSDESPDLNFFAEAGRLPLSRRVDLTILGESLQMDIPLAEISLSEVTRPLPKLQKTTFATLGMRLSILRSPRDKADEDFETEVARCLADRRSRQAGDAECTSIYNINMRAEGNAENDAATWEDVRRARQAGWAFFGGFRFMYDTEDADRSVGIASELGAQYLGEVFRGFASVSYGFVAHSADESENVRTEAISVHELSVIISAEARFRTKFENVQIAPRVGAYFRYSQNLWDNDFAAPGTDASITGQRFEGGFFAAGHFSGGFSGLISLGIAAPYGTRGFDDLAFVVTVSPMIGRPL